MSWYGQLAYRTWADEKFRGWPLSGRLLWIYLCAGEHEAGGLPGLIRMGRASLAEGAGLDDEEFAEAWAALERDNVVQADWRARVVYVVNVHRYRGPDNQKHLKRWRGLLDIVPDCGPKARWIAALRESLSQRGCLDWFTSIIGDVDTVSASRVDTVSQRPADTVSRNGITQDQDQAQDQTQEQLNLTAASATQPEVTSLAHARSKQEALFDVWQTWATELEAKAVADDQPPGMATLYVEHIERAAGEYWDNRGGKFTPKRRADLASRLGRLPPDAQLFAIEQYVNGHRTKDERYCAAIAERLNRLSAREFAFEVDTHRKANPNGIWTLSNDAIGVK